MQDFTSPPTTKASMSPITGLIVLAVRWHGRARRRRALRRLFSDPHLLKDVGLTAEDVAGECAKPFWRI